MSAARHPIAWRRRLLAGLVPCLLATAALAQAEAPPADTPPPSVAAPAAPATARQIVSPQGDQALEARVMALSHQLRCLVCQNESIAESHAPLALDLRNQVREQLAAGQSEDEVVRFLVARYGDFVLFLPPFKPSTYVLWLAPAILLVLALVVLFRLLRRHARTPAPALDDAAQERARALLDDHQQ